MAGVCTKYQDAVVTMIETFLITIGELSNENKGRLRKLGEISKVAASIEEQKGQVKDTPRVNRSIALIRNFCNSLLFGNYTELLTKLADMFSMVKEMVGKHLEDNSFQLPEVMQVRVDSFNHYLEKAKEQMEVIDKMADGLLPKVSRYHPSHVTMTILVFVGYTTVKTIFLRVSWG